MSFLNPNSSEFLSARVTKKGRNAISKGNFVISYFQIGDSEYDYTSPFNQLTGLTTAQKIMSPFDKEAGVKYPYNFDSEDITTSYGTPVQSSTTETVRNIMGSAGFVSSHFPYDEISGTGSTIECVSEVIDITTIDGSNGLIVASGNTYANTQFISIVFDEFTGMDPDFPVIAKNYNSLTYRITGITGNTLYLDREMPDFTALTGNTQIVGNKCEIEVGSCTTTVDHTEQLNPWTLNVVWGDKPIGSDVDGTNESLSGYTSNLFVSAKEYFGYTSTGQTFTNLTGGTISNPTSFTNSFGDIISVSPKEQRCIAVIHYSELGDLTVDPERFFRYDDYISYKTGITGDDISLVDDLDGFPISDTEYFEVYIPFLNYHRNTGTTLGAIFKMDTTDYYIKSTKNGKHQLLYRYLIDEQNNKVGKVFVNNKVIVFDDQELVATLDYRSNRKYTLPAPKVISVPSDGLAVDSLLSGTTGQTVWVTYMFEYSGDTKLNGLPCNYFTKIRGTTSPTDVGFKFTSDVFWHMSDLFDDIKTKFVANKLYALVQWDDSGLELPLYDSWKVIDITSTIPNHTLGQLIDPANLYDYTFKITRTDYDNASGFFDLETYLGAGYLGTTSSSTEPQFGDEQPFPGSVRVIRATDIEQMNLLINLPSTKFIQTQNPTYVDGYQKKITEVALLDSNKDVLIVAKPSIPITRIGTQVLSVKIDF